MREEREARREGVEEREREIEREREQEVNPLLGHKYVAKMYSIITKPN